MFSLADRRACRAWLTLLGSIHLLLLCGLLFGFTDRLSFDTLYRPRRGTTLHVLAEGFHGALKGSGFYHASDPGDGIGPFDSATERPTPAEITLVGAPLCALPSRWQYPAWLLLNEAVLTGVAALLFLRFPDRRRALVFVAAWAAGTPFLVGMASGSPVTLAAAGLLGSALLESRGGATLFGLTTVLRPFFMGIALHALRARRWRRILAVCIAAGATVLLFALHPSDLAIFLGRYPTGGSDPGNLGLQAFLFSSFRNLVPDRPLALPVAGRVIYDLNILSLLAQRLLVFALVGFTAFLSLRARKREQMAAVTALWACTWVAVGVEVREGDFLLVIAATAAMAARDESGWWLPAAALWLALPSPFVGLPVEAILDRSPEFGWSTAQTMAQHGFKLLPAAIVYWLSARACLSAYPNSSG